MTARPRSLQEVQSLASQYGDIDAFLSEFMDEFYTEQDASTRAGMLVAEPEMVEALELVESFYPAKRIPQK
jgi:hypothetical protein